MSGRPKFNPFDLSSKDVAIEESSTHAKIHVRPELNHPLNLLISRCEIFLERARALKDNELTLELQKILSSAKYLHSIVNTTGLMRKAILPLELGSTGDTTFITAPPPEKAAEEKMTAGECGNLLLVDTDTTLLRNLKYLLEQQGHMVTTSQSAEEALAGLHTTEFDVVLMDVVLPKMNGFQLLEIMQADMAWREIPVLILSSSNEPDAGARCIQIGAEDYISKPINPVLLQSRINACVEKKRLHDLEKGYLNQLQVEQEKSERLLLNILPAVIAERLKSGESPIADSFPEVTVLFADLVGFTELASRISPANLVQVLNEIFSAFDELAEKHGLEKIKTIGDNYMIVGGLPIPREDHAEAVAAMALDLQIQMKNFNAARGTDLGMRIGIHTGPVVAGIIGQKKFSYDLWGDTVNIASRMESSGEPGQIQASDVVYQKLKDIFAFAKRGRIEIKGKGEMVTYRLIAKR